MLKPVCNSLSICPWKVQPVVGMWCRVDDKEFWGTNCLLYSVCPHPEFGRVNNAGNSPEEMAQLINFKE